MATLTASEVLDLVATTLQELGEMKTTDIAATLQDYPVMRTMLRENKVSYGSGYGIQWNVTVANNGSARMTGLFEPDVVNQADVQKTASAPWRHMTFDYAVERRVIEMNREPRRLLDIMKSQRYAAFLSAAELWETQAWGKPATSANETDIWGFWYWLVYNATTGFNGGTPTGFSDVAGLNTTTYPRWKNWTAQYTSVTKEDLIAKWREAATKTLFRPPVQINQYANGEGKHQYFVNYDTLGLLETVLEDQNQNLGKDLASMDGEVMFRRVPVKYVPYLDGNAGDPVVGCNMDTFEVSCLEGEYFREDGPKEVANQHNTIRVIVDTTCNLICRDRRKNFLIAKSDPAA